MAYKLLAFAALIAAARAGGLGLGYAAPGLAAYSAPGLATYGTPAVAAPALAYAAAPTYSYAAPAIARVAAPIAYAAPVARAVIAEHSAPAHYDFGYSVSDPITGDQKSQVETRRGDAVQGSYSLLDSDGTKRTVDYVADSINGFNAVVRKEPAGVAVKAFAPAIAAPAVATYAAPAVAKFATPAVASYAAPALATYAAPAVTKFAAPALTTYSAAPAVAYSSPLLTKYAAGPALSYGAIASPLIH